MKLLLVWPDRLGNRVTASVQGETAVAVRRRAIEILRHVPGRSGALITPRSERLYGDVFFLDGRWYFAGTGDAFRVGTSGRRIKD